MKGSGLDYTKKYTPLSDWVFHLAYKVLKKSPKWQGVCYKQYTRILKIDTETKCYKRTRAFSKSTQKWTLAFYKIVHSSRDRHSQSGYRVISRQELLHI
jgi:hypothetical protein